jgi:hypothetical protein
VGTSVQRLKGPAQRFNFLLGRCLICLCLFQLSQYMLHILKHAFENLPNTVNFKNGLGQR